MIYFAIKSKSERKPEHLVNVKNVGVKLRLHSSTPFCLKNCLEFYRNDGYLIFYLAVLLYLNYSHNKK